MSSRLVGFALGGVLLAGAGGMVIFGGDSSDTGRVASASGTSGGVVRAAGGLGGGIGGGAGPQNPKTPHNR